MFPPPTQVPKHSSLPLAKDLALQGIVTTQQIEGLEPHPLTSKGI